ALVHRTGTDGCAIAVTVGGSCLRAVRLNERLRNDRVFVSSRHSLESSILLDCQSSMENISLNDTGAT
ncbi:MAG: hypothetical protein WCD69_30360, partial [Xanthobacteraceae bacterium]